MKTPRSPRLAFDRSSRAYDQAGHLRVADNVLTAAGTSPYLGSEIPGYQRLGLQPNRIYSLLRPAEELRRAASTLAGKPVLARHIEATANDHPTDDVCGAVGSDITFDGSLVKGSITLWTADAIAGVERDEVRSLSCGYYYQPVMTPGTFNGTAYDAVMRGIAFNHVALVINPRIPGAIVNDSALEKTMELEDFEPLVNFLGDKLQGDDISKVKQILAGILDPDDTAGTQSKALAGDSRRPFTPLGRRRPVAPTAADTARVAAMFPNANRLRSY